MKIDYLKTFLTVSKTRNFSAAAKELNLTQGAVSHHIAALEKYFDAQLFRRSPNGVDVTDAGAILCKKAEQILRAIELAKVEISSTRKKLSGMIRIDASSIPGEHLMPSLLAEFQKMHPGVRFKVRAQDSITSLLNLQTGDVDFAAVGSLKEYSEKLDAVELAEEELVLIVPLDHDLANCKSVRMNQIHNYPYIDREETSGTRQEIQRMFEASKIPFSELKTTLELASTESVITAVSESRGISIVSSLAARKAELARLVKVLKIEDVDNRRKLYMVRQKKALLQASEAFWDFCRHYAANKNTTS